MLKVAKSSTLIRSSGQRRPIDASADLQHSSSSDNEDEIVVGGGAKTVLIKNYNSFSQQPQYRRQSIICPTIPRIGEIYNPTVLRNPSSQQHSQQQQSSATTSTTTAPTTTTTSSTSSPSSPLLPSSSSSAAQPQQSQQNHQKPSWQAMHKIQFARGIHQKDLLRANTLPSISRAKVGCFARIHLHEENARFLLVGVGLMMYLTFGAFLFNHLERENELYEREQYRYRMQKLKDRICINKSMCETMHELLSLHDNLSSSGYLQQTDRFDMLGSFFFSGTVISTIGFGMSTPRTQMGKVATVFYGLFGCTCCVLFFNLFLERLITAMTYFLRYYHEQKIRRRQAAAAAGNQNAANKITLIINDGDYGDSASSVDGRIDHWRPSVYKVFGCIFTICMAVIALAASIYSFAEGWPYYDAVYFCFTSFATIGFGDFVSNSNHSNSRVDPNYYRVINFILLTFGASLVYCLFNVSSIVVKQMVNWLIKKMDVKLENPVCCGRRKRTRYMGLGLRPPPGFTGFDISERSSIDSTGDGLLSLKEFLMYNHQSNLVMLQKQLIKSAFRRQESVDDDTEKISATRVGPMGILTEKFGED